MSMDSKSSTATLPDPNDVAKTRIPLPFPLEGVKTHDEFWYADGNLVLVARDVAFRVYRGLLSDQSSVFADMLAAASTDANEVFDGAPIVHLSDSPHDLTHLFRILLPRSGGRFHPRRGDPERSFDEVFSLVRLSHKYHIRNVEEQAMDILRECYTDDFRQWPLGRPLKPISGVHPIGVVNIARLTNTPSLLPTALYQCCFLGPELLDGWKRGDGDIENLSSYDLKRCIAAREVLGRQDAYVLSQIWDGEPSKKCASDCRSTLRDTAQSQANIWLSSPRPISGDCGVLASWAVAIKAAAICAPCKQELILRDLKARIEVWNKLPTIFGIDVPSWRTTVLCADP